MSWELANADEWHPTSPDVALVDWAQAVHFLDVHFACGSTVILHEDGLHRLLCLGQQVKGVFHAAGYTDASQLEHHASRLAELRAMAVRDWLIARGIHPSRIKAIAGGQSVAFASNAANRRAFVGFIFPE